MLWFTAVYSTANGSFTVDGNCVVQENELYKIVLLSNALEDDIKKQCAEILLYGKDAIEKQNGRFTLLLYDKTTHELQCFQDFLCGLSPLYYVQVGEKIYLSTSLKKILTNSKMQRKIDKKAFKKFEIHNALQGNETLIKNLKKLPSQKLLYINKKGLKLCDNLIKVDSYDNFKNDNCESLWKKSIYESVLSCVSDDNETAIPLSSGYDSNCILWNLAQDNTRKICCYCVGGSNGVNEVSFAEQIAKQYSSARFNSVLVSPNTLQSLPDIVWKLEGNVYEQGIFLQYELAKAISKDGWKSIICGEGSDEIFSDNFFNDLSNPDRVQNSFLKRKNMYIWLAQHISRKSTIIMNCFDIIPRYPFSSTVILPLMKYIKETTNTKGKEFHKEFCKKVFPEGVVEQINSVGGKTDLSALFVDEPYKELKLIKKQAGIHFSLLNRMMTTCELLKMVIVNIVKGQTYDIKQERRKRFQNNVMVYLFLKIFLEIFISGKFDKNFENITLKTTLKEILEQNKKREDM